MRLLLLLLPAIISATTYTVKTSDGDYSSIQACANAVSAGDTCEVYSGTYAESVSIPISGSNGNPITFRVHSGDSVSVRQFDVTGRAYITISGFTVNGTSGRGIILTGSSFVVIENNAITTTQAGSGECIYGNSDDSVIRNNVLSVCGKASPGSYSSAGIYSAGDRMIIEDNEVYDLGNDPLYLQGGGTNMVIRNNHFHDFTSNYDANHIDGFQVSGATLNYSLIEGNRFENCSDNIGANDCHAGIVRTAGAADAENIIFRYNKSYNFNAGVMYGFSGDYNSYVRHYNNTMQAGAQINDDSTPDTGTVKNNISYAAGICGDAAVPAYGAIEQNANLAYD